MTLSIEIDADDLAAGLTDLERNVDIELRYAMAEAADEVADEGKRIAPHITGTLGDSVRAEPPTGSGTSIEGSVVADAPYALPVHDGARPHAIYAFRARALSFVQGGVRRFARSVQHPGNQPNPFLEVALRSKAERVVQILDEGFARAMQRAGFG